MGRISCRQGSAAFLHVLTGAKLGIIPAIALAFGLLAAAPAMGATVSVDGNFVLLLNAPADGANGIAVTQGAGNDFTVSDSLVPMTPGAGCAATADPNVVTCSGATSLRLNTGPGNDTVAITASVPSTVFGRDGDDTLTGGDGGDWMEGQAGHDTINVRGPGPDRVVCATGDADNVTSDETDNVDLPCLDDDGARANAHITGGPGNPTADPQPSFSFTADEPGVTFVCTLELASATSADEFPCATPHQETQDLPEGAYVFTVRAVDDVGPGPADSYAFTADRSAPEVIVTRLPPFDTSTAHFQLDAIDASAVTFECDVQKENSANSPSFQPCADIYTTAQLADGNYILFVKGTDGVGKSTTSESPFRIEAVKGGGGVGPPTPPSARPSRIIIDSLVLISGKSVKMSKRGAVTISLQCAGKLRCKGRMSITTAEPVSRKRRKLVTLGSKKFTIAPGKRRNIKVRLSKSKRKLARKLKRFKAKVVIREVDQRGNPRISSRVFILRAR